MDQRLHLVIITALLLPMMGSTILFTLVTITLLFARARIYHYHVRKTMLLNLALAWIPIICAGLALPLFLNSTIKGGAGMGVSIALLFIWFIFFPNSTYLVTEFHHLRDDAHETPFWFDTIVILSLALCGLMLGSFSLLLVHQMLQFYIPGAYAWIIFIIYVFLSNIGIYIGRFLRFNSWDIFTNPRGLGSNLLAIFRDKEKARNLWLFAILFTVFIMTFYLFLYSAVNPVASILLLLMKRPGLLP